MYIVPPSLVSDLNDVNVTAGDTITFTCNSTGYPIPTVTWYKNDDPITDTSSSDNYIVTNNIYAINTRISHLIIRDLNASNNGVYQCQAANTLLNYFVNTSQNAEIFVFSKFTVYLFVIIIIIVPPDYIQGFDVTVYNVSDTMSVYCVFTSIPIAYVTWYRQTVNLSTPEIVTQDNRTTILTSENFEMFLGLNESNLTIHDVLNINITNSDLSVAFSGLTINDLKYTDEGNYSCMADNGVANLISSTTIYTGFITVQSKYMV